MHLFAPLLDRLTVTPSRNRKIALLVSYFASAPDPDRGYALAALTDGVPVRFPLRRVLADLIAARTDPVLYKLSRDYIGDTAETAALLWDEHWTRPAARPGETQPNSPALIDLDDAPAPEGTLLAAGAMTLGQVVTAFQRTPRACVDGLLAAHLDRLDAQGRWALLKLLGGAPRAGVSARLAKIALAAWGGRDVGEIEEIWHALEAPYVTLFAWLEGRAPRPDPGTKPMFRPVMLAHPMESGDWDRLELSNFAAEWKWDGIRVQVSAKPGGVRLFSRAGDDISAAFPEIGQAFAGLDAVADGELLVMREGVIAPFNDLQQRLNRKTVSPRMLSRHPAHVRLYDLLLEAGQDLRALPFGDRRARLEAWHAAHAPPHSDLSMLVPFLTRDDLSELWRGARAGGIEGLMLKRRDGPYLAGRVKGEWYKWKRAPLTLDCVLMYAERGSGKRATFYSDYTFGVWQMEAGGERRLVPVGKAYSGFTDAELKDLDSWIRSHTVERFGPVRAVSPELVLEVSFDAVHLSSRHKSGVAMRFPRIHRIRWDKPAAEADTLVAISALIEAGGDGGHEQLRLI